MRTGRASSSAENIAVIRAHLTRLGALDDVYADRFVTGPKRVVLRALAHLRGPIGNPVFAWIAARTCFYDRLIVDSIGAGVRQVVVLAAGYDTRAWRLASEGVRFVEVDHPDTQERKRAKAPSDGPLFVAVDLSTHSLNEVLSGTELRLDEPIVFTCEGLTMYLREEEVTSLLRQVARLAAPSSRLGVDFGQPASHEQWGLRVELAITKRWAALSGEPIRFLLKPVDAPNFLRRCGWTTTGVYTGAELRERLLVDRELPAPPANGSYVVAATVT
jgi:methyltransferase (TIGR00027 family)